MKHFMGDRFVHELAKAVRNEGTVAVPTGGEGVQYVNHDTRCGLYFVIQMGLTTNVWFVGEGRDSKNDEWVAMSEIVGP